MKTQLSIIIPIYKVEPYLRDCLDSIAASPLDCWEAVLVDDGSPDRCPQICDEYAAKDARFRVIHQENAGVSAARNAGLGAAQGEWVWFVDGDDLVDMRPVGDMMAWLENHRETDLVMFDMERFQDGTTPRRQDYSFSVTDEHLSKNDFLVKHVCYHHQRLWYRKPKDYHGGSSNFHFTEEMKTGEDGEFQFKFLVRCKHPIRVKNLIYYYRLRADSATTNFKAREHIVKDTIIFLQNFLSYLQKERAYIEPWLAIRLQDSMKNLLYSIYKSKQHHMKEMQKKIRSIMDNYSKAGYSAFNRTTLRIAYYSIPCYCILLRTYMFIKRLK